MNRLELKGYAKINLGLDVLRRLENGYHEVNMIMQTVSLCDLITIEKKSSEGISVFTNTDKLLGDGNNLAYKACELLMDEFNIKEGVNIYLQKNIPMAAGLAGGSADAAAVFRGINKMFSLKLTKEQLRERSVKLGADIPYCITGGTYFSEGIGEKLTKLPDIPHCFILLAKPAVSVSTKWVYENLHADKIERHPCMNAVKAAIEENNLYKMCGNIENVLENVTVKKYPIIDEIKKIMKNGGAAVSVMSGSGPTVFGIFDEENNMKNCSLKLSGQNVEIYETVPVNEY